MEKALTFSRVRRTPEPARAAGAIVFLRPLLLFGVRSFRAYYPWRLLLTTLLPRQFVLCIFLTSVGTIAGGASNRTFAFIGATVFAQTIVMVNVADILIDDRENATDDALTTAIPSRASILAARLAPYPLFALACSVAAVAAGPFLGQSTHLLDLATGVPAYLASGLSIATAGAAFAAMVRNAEELVSNAVLWLMILSGGIVRDGAIPWLKPLNLVLPGKHAVVALQNHLMGASMVSDIVGELAVAVFWFLVACLIIWVRSGNERKSRSAAA
ncbi:ABC transporter permease [Streptomyces sp. NPDC095817]|uniref:ABC transporter permease n=1 Tax=Streptomyces sp. NPDC095817 TaxID=3155082 RepID=UPI003318FC18